MKTCYRMFTVLDEGGEVYSFYEPDGKSIKLIHWFDANDASYRAEYLNPLLSHFGIEMLPLPQKFVAKAEKLLEAEY